ncbi:MAG: peptide transporter [Candidatus Firestonebacteria bacterium RIFOXYC2_FULL_39_67]|nr:MAG: peptide transporter [Candidatus Firestonebacteria bacterium RIFOXYD2_FULL_39_29]OGF57374.1 MAG: peptide transporter [Candidatus Firestonebacteria bacterium RIFOXYC2_FULL_39_67]
MFKKEDELKVYRDLIKTPDSFEDGFNLKTILGVLFVALIMLPGSMYLGLVMGDSLGSAAQWVTIILFAEIAKRSYTSLRKQEIYLLYYVAGTMIAGEFGGLIWNQYFVQSQAAIGFGIADKIPHWIAPPADSEAILKRTFFHKDWIKPIALVIVSMVLYRISWFTFGYTLFRVTSDIEKLPFPMAPLAVQGATALAESTEKKETWRWRIFSIGAMIGVIFGAVYVGLPTVTNAMFNQTLQLLPVPFVDMTKNTESLLPATPTGITMNIGVILTGFILPFWLVVGTFIGVIIGFIANPMLYKAGILSRWRPGMDAIGTSFSNSLDFWLSFGIGIAFAVAAVGIYQIIKTVRSSRKEAALKGEIFGNAVPEGRGDFPIPLALGIFVFTTICTVIIGKLLIPGFPIFFFIFFGFIFTPINSYISARMIGMSGQWAGIPMVREATFILSGYKGADIWFAPIPIDNYGGYAQKFREIELTGTKITSIIKAEIFMVPLILVCSIVFWQFIWKLGPIPSAAYPYAQKMWELQALNSSVWISSTVSGNSLLLQVLKPMIMVAGFTSGIVAFLLITILGLPAMLFYGLIRGIGALPHLILPEIFGALLARFYFIKRFGKEQWMQYAPILAVGYAAGIGLIGMVCIAIALISKSVSPLPF